MNDNPVDLDAHRGFASLRATELRRQRLHQLEADREALTQRQEKLERSLATPAESWLEAAAKAQYLIRLLAFTSEVQSGGRQLLIDQTLDDLSRLSKQTKESS